MREASFDVASMAKTSTKVFVMEVMGRHAGWIAAAGGLAADESCPLPIIILFPELPFDEARFIARVDELVKSHGYCSVVVSEGVRSPDGQFLSDQGIRDAFGHAQLGGVAPVIANLVREHLKLKYHWAVADYLQRAARHIASKTDVEQAYALGKAAVELAIVRESDSPYRWRLGEARLEDIANQERKMPRDFISEDGFGISDAGRRYLLPLIQGEDYPPYRNGLPDYVRLRNVAVPRKTASNFALK